MAKKTAILPWRRFALICLLVVGASAIPSPAQNQVKQSSPFRYSGYTSPQWKNFVKQSQFVPMADGVKLAVDIFLPSEGPNGGPFPVAFSYTPYGRAAIDLKTGKIFDSATTPLDWLFLSHGYALVTADMRGSGASFGTQMPFSPVLGVDGKALVDWIAGQKWCNGKVGMYGQSYLGWSQLATTRHKPQALKCIMPEVIVFEGYTEGFRPGGIEAVNWIKNYSLYLQGFNLNVYRPEAGIFPSAPVLDEDGDGEFRDEVPLADKGDPSTFLDDGFPPRYTDGKERSGHYYFLACREHAANPTFADMAAGLPFIDSNFEASHESMTPAAASPSSWIPEIAASGIPIHHLGGWFDGFCKGTFKLYATLEGKTPERLLAAPRFHMPWVTPAYQQYFHYADDLGLQLNIEKLRFFDRYLKDIPNGIDTELPVSIYVMNKGWRAEKEWPVARQVVTAYYFDQNSRLETTRSQDGSDDYQVDFGHNSLYGSNKSDRWFMMAPPDQLMVRTEKDKQCLFYETGPLDNDLEVTGHPVVELWVTSDQKYGDFFATLVDVDANGQSLHVTEGCLRSDWTELYKDDDQVHGLLDVRPDLPWHGYRQSQRIEGGLNATDPVKLRFDLFPTSWVFRKGHRVRVAIAGADYPNFSLNPGLAPHGKPEECPRTRITIHRTGKYASRIELPIIRDKK